MKRFVNGHEVELEHSEGVSVTKLPDRLMVRTPDGTHSAVAVRQGDTVLVSYKGRQYKIEKATRSRLASRGGTGEVHAPMPGQIVDVMVEPGQQVMKGDKLLVLEAMKTQQAFTAPFDGTVSKVPVAKGEQVPEGALLALVEEAASGG